MFELMQLITNVVEHPLCMDIPWWRIQWKINKTNTNMQHHHTKQHQHATSSYKTARECTSTHVFSDLHGYKPNTKMTCLWLLQKRILLRITFEAWFFERLPLLLYKRWIINWTMNWFVNCHNVMIYYDYRM